MQIANEDTAVPYVASTSGYLTIDYTSPTPGDFLALFYSGKMPS